MIAALDPRQDAAWAARFRQCMGGGATGFEMILALAAPKIATKGSRARDRHDYVGMAPGGAHQEGSIRFVIGGAPLSMIIARSPQMI